MKNSVSVKLIVLVLLVIFTLPLAIAISVSVLSKLQDDAKAVNTIGYIRGSSQRLTQMLSPQERFSMLKEVEKKFDDIEKVYTSNNLSYIKETQFIQHYSKLRSCWNQLNKLTKQVQPSLEKVHTLEKQCWESADKTANITESISHIKYDQSAMIFLLVGCFILLLLIITIVVIHTEVKNKLEKSVIQDPLTKLYNRNYLYTKLESKIKVFQRTQDPFTLLFIDMDHFKRINDDFGHSTGDLVLKKFASIVTKVLREDDLAFRFGGEEFVVLAAHANSEQAFFLAERIRLAVENYHFHTNFSVSISVGICEFKEGNTLDEIIDTADNMMYQAKAKGRNQSCIYKATN